MPKSVFGHLCHIYISLRQLRKKPANAMTLGGSRRPCRTAIVRTSRLLIGPLAVPRRVHHSIFGPMMMCPGYVVLDIIISIYRPRSGHQTRSTQQHIPQQTYPSFGQWATVAGAQIALSP